MIKGIVYLQCQRWVMKLSLKESIWWFFYVIRKKLALCKEDGESFFDIGFYIFDNEEKEFRKSVKEILMKKY